MMFSKPCNTVTVNAVALVAVTQLLYKVIVPLVAPTGTVAVIVVEFTTVNDAGKPLKRTTDTLLNPVPVTVTVDPSNPLAGLNDAITGVWLTVIVIPLDVTVELPVIHNALDVTVHVTTSPLTKLVV